jgi:hypothetical protein
VSNPSPDLVELLNRVDTGCRVLTHCVPTRIIRVSMNSQFAWSTNSFRVEQLVQTNRVPLKGSWKTLSTHTVLNVAISAAHKAQLDLIAKLRARLSVHGRNSIAPIKTGYIQ